MSNDIQLFKDAPLLAAKVEFTQTSLEVTQDLSEEEQDVLWQRLATVHGGTQWWIGDLWNAQEKKYGRAAEFAERHGLETRTVQEYGTVCSRVRSTIRIVNLSFAHHQLVAAMEPDEQRKWLGKAAADGWTVARLRSELGKANTPEPLSDSELAKAGLFVADFREFSIPSASVDLVFTDPPYDNGALPLYGALAERAAEWLRPGGLCLAYAGQFALPRIMELMSEHLDYVWTFAIRHTGGELRFRKWRVYNSWKPVVAFGKDVKAWWDWLPDIVSGGKEKDLHPWQQAEAEAAHYLRLCPEGGMVVDPMCGSGSVPAAAKKMGLRYVGIDVDAAALTAAEERLR